MGNNFFLKEIFLGEILGSMFWRSRFFWGGNFASKIYREFFASKTSFGGIKNTGKPKCFGGKIWVAKNFESKFLSLMVSP